MTDEEIREWEKASLRFSMFNSLPCVVKTFYSTGKNAGKADLTPVVKISAPAQTGGSYPSEDLQPIPTITNVPILWPALGGAKFAWKLLPGDGVLLVCTREDASVWFDKGGTTPVDSAIPGSHGLHGFAIPGMASSKTVPVGIDKTGVSMESAVFRFMSNLAASEKALALAERVKSELDKIVQAMNTLRSGTLALADWCNFHTHPETGGTTSAPTTPFLTINVPPHNYNPVIPSSTKVFTDD